MALSLTLFIAASVVASILQATSTATAPVAKDEVEVGDLVSLLQVQQAQAIKMRPHEVPPAGKINVDSIAARGTVGAAPRDKPSDQYTLSADAASFGITEDNALLQGGSEEIILFPNGSVPEELPGDAGPQVLQVNDPGDACAAGDVSGYSILSVNTPSLVSFIVPQGNQNRRDAAVIIAPGGGSRFLSWNKEGTQVAKWLNSIGISAFVLKYRVPCNSFETKMKPVVDSQRAISVVRKLAETHGFKKVGFMGFSAGGFIAAGVNFMTTRAYPPIDATDQLSFRPDFSLLIYSSSAPETRSPLNPPPTFIGIARDDPCVSQQDAAAYYSALTATGGNHELHIFAGGKHGYGDCSLYVTDGSWQPVCAWTLNAQLFIENVLGVPIGGRKLGAMTYPRPEQTM